MFLSNEILEIAYHNVSNGIYITDGKGVTLGVNKPYEAMSGIKSEDIVGKSLYQLVYIDKMFSGSASLLVLEKKVPVTVTYYTETDKKFLSKGKPIFNEDGEIIYIINTVWDLTSISYKKYIDSDTARDVVLDGSNFISCSPQMIQILELCVKVADTDSSIVMTGESGVGKSLLAAIIHQAGNKKNFPLIKLNCAAIPEGLIESELFGYTKGAFTGADNRGKIGLFEAADGGIIFLDEISELPLYSQSKLLGVLQDKEFTPVGGIKSKKVDVRVIAASNKNLWQMVKDGKFREDLYYRLNVIPINIPPLRQRPEDIAPLAASFLEQFNKRYGSYKKLSEQVIKYMERLPWHGNVRELENMIERLVVTSKSDVIELKDYEVIAFSGYQAGTLSLTSQLDNLEKEIIKQAMKSGSSTRKLAKLLQISQASVVRKMKKHGIKACFDSK